MKRTKTKNKLVVIVLCYLILLHIFIVLILLKTDILHKISYKIGFSFSQFELSDFYNKMVIHQIRSDNNVPKKSIIFFGDSITQELCVNAVLNNGINYGIGGDTTYGLLQRIQKYQSINDASVIVIAIGINDILHRSKNDIINNYKRILNFIPDNKNIIISAILPIDEQIIKNKLNLTIKDINQELKKLASTSHKKILFVDSSKSLSDSKGDLRSLFHVGDGIHLNENGYKIWINDLKTILASVIKFTTNE